MSQKGQKGFLSSFLSVVSRGNPSITLYVIMSLFCFSYLLPALALFVIRVVTKPFNKDKYVIRSFALLRINSAKNLDLSTLIPALALFVILSEAKNLNTWSENHDFLCQIKILRGVYPEQSEGPNDMRFSRLRGFVTSLKSTGLTALCGVAKTTAA